MRDRVTGVRDRVTGEYIAMKSISIDDNNISFHITREISRLYEVDHENIIKLKRVYPYNNRLYSDGGWGYEFV